MGTIRPCRGDGEVVVASSSDAAAKDTPMKTFNENTMKSALAKDERDDDIMGCNRNETNDQCGWAWQRLQNDSGTTSQLGNDYETSDNE